MPRPSAATRPRSTAPKAGRPSRRTIAVTTLRLTRDTFEIAAATRLVTSSPGSASALSRLTLTASISHLEYQLDGKVAAQGEEALGRMIALMDKHAGSGCHPQSHGRDSGSRKNLTCGADYRLHRAKNLLYLS